MQNIEPNPAWLLTIPVLSTMHISEKTAKNIATFPAITVANYGEGFFLNTDIDTDDQGLPADLIALYAWAQANNFLWVRLDSIGDTLKNLPVYNWN